MDTNGERLRSLLSQLNTIGFWERIFGWTRIKHLLIDAAADIQQLTSAFNAAKEESVRKTYETESLNSKLSVQGEQLAALNQKLESAVQERDDYKAKSMRLENNEVHRNEEHAKTIATITQITKRLQDERNGEVEVARQKEIDKLLRMKETWSLHQENVKNTIKTVCNKLTIEYIDKVPFKGEPDNTLRICDEYIVFDAKSPAGEDLANFNAYLKAQAESAKKYAREEGVKKDIYFVVPVNTIESLKQLVFSLADYRVFIISPDAIEPIVLSLQKIEDYEFAEQLSPEDRENICRVLGKFAHLSKRRIQVDSFFAAQFLELAYKSENELPKDVFEKMVEYEKADKLNPPVEKRAKQISRIELEQEHAKVNREAEAKGISMKPDALSDQLNNLPLYNDDIA